MDLSGMGGLSAERKLFSESNTRWIAEVEEKDVPEFEKIMGPDATCIGRTGGDRFIVKGTGIDIPVKEIRKAWNDPIWDLMGGGAE